MLSMLNANAVVTVPAGTGKVKAGSTVDCSLVESGVGGSVQALGLFGGGEVKVAKQGLGFATTGFLGGVANRISSMR